ncbi:MAG: anthranilate synthase component I family protein [Candidatus Omnitrophica bacterium]|nr:anthranilate synthase component I family protein [Candidatus Omnitrophota bacterium]
MMVRPSRRTFRALSRCGLRVPVAATLAQEASPQVLFEALRFAPPHALLESARLHPVTGRYSVIVGEPRTVFSARGREVRIQEGARDDPRVTQHPLLALQRLLDGQRAVRLPGLPPFVGGAVGFIGFDACRLLEKIPSRAADDLSLPDMGFLLCDEAVVVDHARERVWAVCLADAGGDPDRSYGLAAARVERLVERIRRSTQGVSGELRAVSGPSVPGLILAPPNGHWVPRITCTHTRESFEEMVRAAKGFIADGEIYQANLSQRLTVDRREHPWLSYRRLTEINPSPFACYADFPDAAPGGLQIVSSSPERLLRVRGGVVETRPIAGTRPRGRSAVETARLRRELILNEKERAEHLMLVDLERNDLGRVCRYGSVRVDDLMALEEYSHVIHIVSNVRGVLRAGVGVAELFAACFPGGTISGCPKIRSLEIIDELEPVRRQLYTGCFGYASATGEMDFNLLIRTGFVRGGQVAIQAGSGIVADSDPGREYEETLHKAQALRQVFEGRQTVIASDQRERSNLCGAEEIAQPVPSRDRFGPLRGSRGDGEGSALRASSQ